MSYLWRYIEHSFQDKDIRESGEKLNFTERQATAILELRLQKLIGLELEALQKEYAAILKTLPIIKIF